MNSRRKPLALTWLALVACGLWLHDPAAPLQAAESSTSAYRQGVEWLEAGNAHDAAHFWEKAFHAAQASHRPSDEEWAAFYWAQSLQNLGRYRPAAQLLEQLSIKASNATHIYNLPLIQSRLAPAFILTRDLDKAEKLILPTLSQARAENGSTLLPGLLNDYGNLLATQQKYADALAAYQESAQRAEQIGNTSLAADALVNAAALSLLTPTPLSTTTNLIQGALAKNAESKPSYAQGMLYLKAGQIQMELAKAAGLDRNHLMLSARQTLQRTLDLAEQKKMELLKSHALGHMARLYEQDGQIDAALQLARRAAFSAQQTQSAETLYQWEWIIARCLTRQGEMEAGMQAYRNAAQTLQGIRHDLSLGHGNLLTPQSFREGQGTLYVELADLLLRQSAKASQATEEQKLLSEARDTIEMLKAVELESYLCDECADLQRSKARFLESVDARTAVLYIIPLPDRTELLVGLNSGLRRISASMGASVLENDVREFRQYLETRTSYEFLEPARRLYDAMIRPVRSLLASNSIHTLVIVPDGAMRTIPFAALHDGERYLIEDLAVAVVPGLSLVEPRPLEPHQTRLLLSGLSKSVQGFAPLDNVPLELQSIRNSFAGDTLLNEGFTSSQLQSRLAEDQYSVVHIASHGKFDRDVRNTFVLTYDGRLTLDHLEALIRPSQYRGRPVELLVLSACQTAAGDDRAALGLAGVAIKAGARSALATLWFVNDQSTSTLVTGLYEQLKQNPTLSKARALQAAQMAMLRDRRFFHPCYWSPYLLIGNWL